MLEAGEFDRARQAQKSLGEGYRALKSRNADAALSAVEKAESLNPGFYQNATLQGRALLALGRNAEAIKAFEAAQGEQPAFRSERRELETLVKPRQGIKER